MAIVIGVRFARNSKIYYFDPSDVWPAIGDGVICDTSRGPEYGVVAASAREVEDDMLQLPLRKVLSMATEEDVERVKENEKLGREAMLKCKDKIAEHKLEMKLIDVEVAFDNSKMVFYFTANGRRRSRRPPAPAGSGLHTGYEAGRISRFAYCTAYRTISAFPPGERGRPFWPPAYRDGARK